ncbi:hypothetical protein BC938DRAFT_474971 [Jimgerdemannia flammicorona]|uniref:Uncharacterized protein n=1 Tax=Jimgerdemannia flammicorona TaxID=994334 RepID=A0A433Q155_9FUNG|nr:hypothetical protein BC938DRAFT_474971 [Jimgerdemannia flammicorona]
MEARRWRLVRKIFAARGSSMEARRWRLVYGGSSMEEARRWRLASGASLKLWSCNIWDESANAIANALKTNKTFASLDLNGNEIGEEGGKGIAMVLKPTKLSSHWI